MFDQAFVDLFKEKGERPTAVAVRDRLLLMGCHTPVNQRADSPMFFSRIPNESLFNLPEASWAQKRLQTLQDLEVDPEELWTLKRTDNVDPASTRAVMAVWHYAMTSPNPEPLTQVLAEWIAKLRYLPEAGGRLDGEAADPDKLFRWAAQFSAREKTAKRNKESNTRTDVVLAKLTMSEIQYAQAARAKVINDEGIDLEQELITYYPDQGLQARVTEDLLAGQRPDLGPYIKLADELLAEYPEDIRQVWNMGLGLTSRFPRWNELRDDDEHDGAGPAMALALLKDITEFYDRGPEASLVRYEPLERIPMIIEWLEQYWIEHQPQKGDKLPIGGLPF